MIPEFKDLDLLRLGGLKAPKKSPIDKKYATLNRRMLAATIDSFVLLLPAPLINKLVPINTASLQKYAIDSNDPQAARLYLIHLLTDHDFILTWLANGMAQMLVFFLFSAVCWHFWSATPGKMLFRIRIADAVTERPISQQQIALRLCGYIVSMLPFLMGFFWVAFDKKRQGWHDKIAHTVVLVKPWVKSDSPVAGPSGFPGPSAGE